VPEWHRALIIFRMFCFACYEDILQFGDDAGLKVVGESISVNCFGEGKKSMIRRRRSNAESISMSERSVGL
jgi:hypothetical protein